MSTDASNVMAYVDGELDAPARAAFEAVLARDAALRDAVDRERRLRQALAQAYDPVLSEPVPLQLRAVLPAPPAPAAGTAPAVDLAAARAARSAAPPVRRRQWHWPEWGAMAACLVLGTATGLLLDTAWRPARGSASGESATLAVLSDGAGGQVVAQGALDRRLFTGLASEPQPAAGVALGISFQARDGRYCRSFELQGQNATAGLACREAGGWAVQALAAVPAAPSAATASPAYRQAASALPPAVLQQLDTLGAGPMLDADSERAARNRGWRH